ncbi:alpha/beta hydrolase [Aestuariibacter sp. GS-14]|nr:alpha/beta hydrolase [Aestuariibacter sp. GS-14]
MFALTKIQQRNCMRRFFICTPTTSKWVFLSFFLFTSNTFADVIVKPMGLYEGKIPGSIKSDNPGTIFRESPGDKFITAVSSPSLTAYLPESMESLAPAVIICPGGGYFGLSSIKEGEEVARRFASNGIAAFVLFYRMPSAETMDIPNEGPLQDLQQAISTVHALAKSMSVDPNKIGVMGFSAGGHLAATSATLFSSPVLDTHKQTVRPAFQILIYPVISMNDALTHEGSRNLLLGNISDSETRTELITHFSNEKNVTLTTPPAYLVHATDDEVVVVENTLQYFDALRANKVSVQMLIVPDGGHGFGMRHRVDWFSDVLDWVKHQ